MGKGIKDPWRVVDPIKPEPAKPKPPDQKRNVGEADFDADMRDAPHFDFRGARGAVRVSASNGYEALEKIVKFLDSLEEIDAVIGYKSDKQAVQFNTEDFVSGSVWKTTQDSHEVLVCFYGCDNDTALLLLVNCLIREQRKNKNLYKQFGLHPIQK